MTVARVMAPYKLSYYYYLELTYRPISNMLLTGGPLPGLVWEIRGEAEGKRGQQQSMRFLTTSDGL